MEKNVVRSQERKWKALTADRSFNKFNFPRLSHDFFVLNIMWSNHLLLIAPPKGIKLCIFRDKLCIYICRWNTLKHMQKYRPKMGQKSGLTIWRIESTYTKLCYDKPNRYILWHQVPYVPTLTNILTYILILEAYCLLLFSGDKVYFCIYEQCQ